MSIEHKEWEILANRETQKNDTIMACVLLSYIIHDDGDPIHGHQMVFVDLSSFSERPRPRRIVAMARRILEDYFDGKSAGNPNLFSDCFEKKCGGGISIEDEVSLAIELALIEREFGPSAERSTNCTADKVCKSACSETR